jgi:hypothetical protein
VRRKKRRYAKSFWLSTATNFLTYSASFAGPVLALFLIVSQSQRTHEAAFTAKIR